MKKQHTHQAMLLGSLLFSLTACSGSGSSPAPTATKTESSVTKPAQTAQTTTAAKPTTPTTTTPSQPVVASTPKTDAATTTPAKPTAPTTTPSQPVVPSTPKTDTATTPAKPTTPTTTSPGTTVDKPSNDDAKDKFVELRQLPIGEIKNEDVGFGKITGYNNHYSFNGAYKEHESVGEIVVDNVKLSITKKLKMAGLSGAALASSLESAWNTAVKNPHREIFYFGDETSARKIAQLKGQALYQGVATRYDNLSGDVQNIGKSTLNADFDNKKISGELAINGLLRRNISLKEADIQGNGFTGKAIAGENHIIRSVEGRYEGKFFGPNAEEVAGKATFTGEAIIGNGLRDLDTSFSAEKTTK